MAPAPTTEMTRTQARRAALRERLIDVAEARIASEGLSAVRARDLSRDAGCSVGAIYTLFDDLNDLILAVNGRTFSAMGLEISQAVTEVGTAPPAARMIAMANAYLSFATAHPRRWKALFDIEMSVSSGVPEWYVAALGKLFSLIAEPLRELSANADDAQIDTMTRGMFSAVHGIVLLGVENRISAVPTSQLRDMIAFIITAASDATSD